MNFYNFFYNIYNYLNCFNIDYSEFNNYFVYDNNLLPSSNNKINFWDYESYYNI
jgi:hypothetical protein